MARKGIHPTEPETPPVEQPTEPRPTPDTPNNPPEPTPQAPPPDKLAATNGHTDPMAAARAARKTGVKGPRMVFYVIVGTTRDGLSRDILGEGKSRRGAEKLKDSMRQVTGRTYGAVEVWKCRK